MSTMPGLASKAEKGKSKFQSLDINNLYRHSLGENLERSAQKSAAPLKHGMQSLGKVPSARRPPANLPSVKAEQNNTSSTPTTATSDSQVATAAAGGSGNAVAPLLHQEQQSQQPQSWVGKQGTGDKIGAVVGAAGLPTATLATTGPQSQQQQLQLQPQLSAHQAAIALPVTNTILPPAQKQQQQTAQQPNAQQLTAQQQIQQGTLNVYHLTAVQQAQLQHLQMQTAAVAAAAAQVAQAQQTQVGTGPSQQGANGAAGPADKSWSAVMSSVNVDGHSAMMAMGATMGLGGTVGGGGAGSHHHHHHPLHHHGMQGVGGMQQPPPYHSVQFQHEFPSLSAPVAAAATADSGGATAGAGGNVGNGRVGNQGGMAAQQSQLVQQQQPPPPAPLPLGGPDVQYGPGPSLRPQTEGSWMQGGGAQVRTPGQQQQQVTPAVAGQGNQSSQNAAVAQGTQQIPAHFRGIMPPFMFRGGNFPPMNGGHHGPLPTQHQQSMGAQQHHHPQHSDGRQGHQGAPRRGGGAPSDQPVEVITHRPIIREEELSRMDDMVRDMGWAAHEDIDYNQQLAFSDDDDSVIEDGAGKMQGGGAGGQRGKMQGSNRNDHRSDRSDHHQRSGSHPNHQSQSQQQQHKESLHHHHAVHQQHQDSSNSNYPSSYGPRQQQPQQQQPAQVSSASSGSNQAGPAGGQNVSSATLTQQRSWSSSGSSSTGGSGSGRSGGAVITRRSNECDDEIAERRRQQNQAMSTVIERARQRKEEEEKRYLDSKQAANKKLQELDERSKNKREQRELDESSGTITQASVPPQPIMHSTIPVPEWEREKDNRDNRERILRENSEEKSLKSSISDENAVITPSPSASSFHQLTQIESSRGTTYRKDNTSGSMTSMRTGGGNTSTDAGAPPPFSRQFQTNLPPRFQKQKQQASGGTSNSGGPSSLGSLGGQYDQGRYGMGKGSSPPQQQHDRGDRQQQVQPQRGTKEDKDMIQRDRDRDMIRDDRERDDHSSRGYGGNRGKQTANSNAPSGSSNLPQGSDDGITYRQTRYSTSSTNRYSDEYSRDYDYNSNTNTGSGNNRTGSIGKSSNNMTSSSSVGKELDRRGYEKQDSVEMDNMRGSRHSSSDEWGSGRDRFDRERPQRPDSRDSRASRDSRHSMESAPRHSETRDFSSWSESPYEPPYEADQQHKLQHKHQPQQQSRHLAVPGPITKERLEQSSDDIKSSDKHHGGGQTHHHSGGQQHQMHQQPQRTGGLTQLKRGGGGAEKKIVADDAWTIRRGGSSSTKEGSGTSDAGGGTGGAGSTAWADSIPDDKQQGKQISDHHDNKKDYDDPKGRRNDNRNTGSNKGSNNWSDTGREPAPYSRNNSWTSSKKSSSSTSSVSGGVSGGGAGNRSDRSERLPQYGRNQRPPSVKSGESEGSADEVSANVENSAKDEVTKHIKKIEKDEKNKEILRAIQPEPIKKPQLSNASDSKSKDGGNSGNSAAYVPRGEPSRHGRGGGSSSASFRGGRSGTGGGVKRMDYYGLPAASKSPFGNNQDDKDKKSIDDGAAASHITDEDKAKVQQKKEQLPHEQDKERYGKPKRSDNRRNKPRGPKDDSDLVSDNSEDGKGGKRFDNQQKSSSNRGGGGSGNLPASGGGRKPTTSSATGGQLGSQQQSRQQSNSDKRYGNSYNNNGRQNSSGNLRNSARKDDNSTKEEDEDELPRNEDSFQEVRNKKTTPITSKKQEDIKPIGPTTTVGSIKVPVSSGGGAIVVAPASSTTMASAPAPGAKVDKDGPKAIGTNGGSKSGGKPGGPPGLSQQHIANIPSLMSVPVNPPMMKGQYERDRDRAARQNKLAPRFAKQREHRLNNQHQPQHVGPAHMDQQSSIHTSNTTTDVIKPAASTPVAFGPDSGMQISSGGGSTASASSMTGSTPVGNAWDKPLAVGQLRSGSGGLVVESDGVMVGGLVGDGVGKVKAGDVDKSGMLSDCAAPVNTIIFENSNYKSTSSPAGTAVRVPITTNRNTGPPLPQSGGNSVSSSIVGSTTQPRSIQQQMEDQAAAAAEAAVLGTLSSGKGDKGSKGDVDMMFSKEDDAGMKMDFFESEISHLTDDKSSSKNIGLARSIQQTMVGSTAGSISASTADALNIKIQSVKKVWENANDHPVVVQDDGSGFVGGFGSDHNSLDPSGAFGKGADTPDDAHEGYSPSPNQAVSSSNTNVCKVKPNQQATAAAAAAAAAAAQAAGHPGSLVSPGSMVSVAQQQHQQQQAHVQQAQHQAVHAQQAAAVVAAQAAAAQAVAAQAAAAQVAQMGHHGSTMVGHQVLGHPLSPPPQMPGGAVLGAASCQPTGGGGAFGSGQHLGYQSLGGTTSYNLSAIPSPPTVLHQFNSSQSQLQAAVAAAAAAAQQNSIYGNFSQMDAQSHQVATARAPQYGTPQYANPYGIGATASSPYSTSVPPPPQSLYLPPSGPPPPHGPPPGSSGSGAPGSVPPPPDHLYQNLNNYRLAAAAAAAAAGGSPFGNQQSNPATVLISSSNNSSLMSASVVGKSGVGGGSGNGGGGSGSGQISAIGTKAGGVGPAYTSHTHSHSHSQQAAQQLAYMTYDLSMGAYHMPPPPQQRGQQGGGPPPGPPPQGSSQVQQSNNSYYNQNTGGQPGYFQPQQSSGLNNTGQQPQLGNGGAGGGLATQHAAAAAAYGLQAVATAAALFGNQSHQPINNATSLQNYGSHYLSNNMLAAINVQQQQQQQQQQYRNQQQYMKSSNQQLMDQQLGSGGRQQLKSPGSQQDGLSSVFNSSQQIPSPKARQQNCKVQPQQQQLAQMPQPSPPVSNVQHNKYNLYNVPPSVTNQPPPQQARYPAPIQRPVNFQANLGSAQNTVSGNNPKHRPNNPNTRPSTGARQYYGQALNHTVNDVAKSDEIVISKLSEQIVSTGGAANGTTVSTAAQKAAAAVTSGTNSNVPSNVTAPVSNDSIASAKDSNNSNQQPSATNKDETSATAGIKD